MPFHRKLALSLLLLLVSLPAVAQPVAQPQCRLPPQLEAQACDRPQQGRETPRGTPGDFDHYILSLSWSPAFCASQAGQRSPMQCRDNTFGWVVHGLWPQYRGKRDGAGWPQYCAAVQPVPAEILRRHLCLMPEPQLMQCQWAKHGSCSDFTEPDGYFAAIARMWETLVLPEPQPGQSARDYSATLVAANGSGGLSRRSLRVLGGDAGLRELHLCLSRDLTRFTACE
ncbi:hypothetical protein [Ferrovibrio sp.]|uniref:ribonuclease T2 family protein n=1 Tax=Ferrovibrio sp. TaxID=1917215 RepID=UPI00260FE022|nr:hypothetical protein [Ferrovibrio sp.]